MEFKEINRDNETENVLNLINCWLKKTKKSKKSQTSEIELISNECIFGWNVIQIMTRVHICMCVWCVFVWKCIHFWLHITKSWIFFLHHLHFCSGLRQWRYCDIWWQWYCLCREYICIAFFSHSDSLCLLVCSIFIRIRYIVAFLSRASTFGAWFSHDTHSVNEQFLRTTIYTRTKFYSCMFISYLRRLHNTIVMCVVFGLYA